MQAAANAAVDQIEERCKSFRNWPVTRLLTSFSARCFPFRHHDIAAEVFQEFRAYQRAQPILNIAAFVHFLFRSWNTIATAVRLRVCQLIRIDPSTRRSDCSRTRPMIWPQIATPPDPELGAV